MISRTGDRPPVRRPSAMSPSARTTRATATWSNSVSVYKPFRTSPGAPSMSFVDRHSLSRLVGFVWVCVAALSAGCAPGRDLPRLPPYEASAYRLGGGDQLRIITYGEDQLTGEFRVDD